MKAPPLLPTDNNSGQAVAGSKRDKSIFVTALNPECSSTLTCPTSRPFHTKVITATVRDATHVLDGLLYHERPLIEEHYTDTAGFTDHVLPSAICWASALRRAFATWPTDASMFPIKEVRTPRRESDRRGR